MTERLVYPSRRRLRSMQLGAGAVAAALVVGGVLLEFSRSQWAVAGLLVLSAAWTIVALEWRVRRPLPELRLSTAGIEGAFGLIEWQDVTGVDAKTRFRLHARGVIVRLRPGAHLLLPTREFAEVGDEIQALFRDRLELETGHLELGARELSREIERFRMSA